MRILHLVLATALAATVALLASPALAGPGRQAACSATSCLSLRNATLGAVEAPLGDTAEVTYGLEVSGADASAATFRSHQDPRTPVVEGSVQVNFRQVDAGAATYADGDVTLDLTAGGPLAVGAYNVSYTVRLDAAARGRITSWASIDFRRTAGDALATASSDDVVVVPQRPDLSVSGTGPGRGGHGYLSAFDFPVRLSGASVVAATARITAPTGVHVERVENASANPVDCAIAPRLVTCRLPAVRANRLADLVMIVRISDRLDVGEELAASATVAPVGIKDADPSDNTAISTIVVSPVADLHIEESIPSTTLLLGVPTQARIEVTNNGPDEAPGTILYAGVRTLKQAFRVGIVGDPPNAQAVQAIASFRLGTLAPGAVVSRTIRITALSDDDPHALLFATVQSSGSDDPVFQCGALHCELQVARKLTVLRQAPPTGGPPLADTGTPAGDLTMFGLRLLCAGVLLVAGARQRRQRVSRR